jgi:hypothetical protein
MTVRILNREEPGALSRIEAFRRGRVSSRRHVAVQ